jgi:oxygen-independent coproporphyrinogen-3 oxidase
MKPHQKLIDAAELAGEAERLEQSEAAAERLAAEGYVRIGLDHYAREDDDLACATREGRLHRNFQGYTTDEAETVLAFGASAIGRLPQGFVQNASSELAWRQAIAAGRLATARGLAFTDEDRFRAEIIESLMCNFVADLGVACARHGRDPRALAPAIDRLAAFEADGLVAVEAARVAITPLGRPFVRQVCAVFDAHLAPGAERHSSAV